MSLLGAAGAWREQEIRKPRGFWDRVATNFRIDYPDTNFTPKQLRDHHQNILRNETLQDGRKERVVNRPNSKNDENLKNRLTELVEANPRESYHFVWLEIRQVAEYASISFSQTKKVIKSLGFRAYKGRQFQALTEYHCETRVLFCQALLAMAAWLVPITWFSDEAKFSLQNPTVNSQNRRYRVNGRVSDVPEDFYLDFGRSQGGQSIHVFACVKMGRRPYVYVIPPGSVNGAKYRRYLGRFLGPANGVGFVKGEEAFQQDGASPHRCHETIDYLDRMCGELVIALNSRSDLCPEWPPRSPDLSPLDFWFWGTIKTRIQAAGPWPRTQDAMVTAINREVDAMDQAEIDRAIWNITKRAEKCIEREGHHFEQLM